MLTNLVIIRSLILVLYFIIFVLLVIGQGICMLSTTRWEDVSTPRPTNYYGHYYHERPNYGDSSSTVAPPMIPRCNSELRVPLIIWHENDAARFQYAALILLIIMFVSAVGPLRAALDGKVHKGCARPICCVLSFILTAGELAMSLKTPYFLYDTKWERGILVGDRYKPFKLDTWAYVESWMVAAFLFFVVLILQAIDYFNDRNPDLQDGCCGDSCDCGFCAGACGCCSGDCDGQWEQAQKQNMAATGPQPKTSIEQIAMIGQPPGSTTNQPQIVVTPQQQPSTSSVDNKSKIDPSMPKSDSERSKKGSNDILRLEGKLSKAQMNPWAK